MAPNLSLQSVEAYALMQLLFDLVPHPIIEVLLHCVEARRPDVSASSGMPWCWTVEVSRWKPRSNSAGSKTSHRSRKR
eukprot:scaffold75748_cov13-Prasinocladus_malaysianus.AAC.1